MDLRRTICEGLSIICDTAVNRRYDPENDLLMKPGYYLIRAASSRTIRGILEGLRKMARDASHSIPDEFDDRQILYIQRPHLMCS